ncbi:unnamed protein product [Parajaminaea phylloscopi]
MEAARAARQARLADLRQTKESQAEAEPSAQTSIHPFRRAISNVTSRRSRADRADEDGDGDGLGRKAQEDAMTQLAESSREGQLLRKYRNWDPRTGQARDGAWNTVTGIEDEMRNVQLSTLEQDAVARAADLNLSTLAPRKPNWDLRRHLDKRLKKLEKRDKEARLILIRQRLKAASAAPHGAQQGEGGVHANGSEDAQERLGRLAAMSTLTGLSGSSGLLAESDASDTSSDEDERD